MFNMNFLEYENLYNKTLEKLTQIILEETEADPEDIILDLELSKLTRFNSQITNLKDLTYKVTF